MEILRRCWKSVARVAVLGCFYYAAARLGLWFSFAESNASPVWPAAGVAVAGLLFLGPRAWMGIWLGAFASNVVDFFSTAPATPSTILWASAVIAAGNTLEAVLGWWLCKRWLRNGAPTRWPEPLSMGGNLLRFAALALLISLLSACVGPTVVCAAGIEPWSRFWFIGLLWWGGNAAGVLLVTPFLLAWAPPLKIPWRPALWSEGLAAFSLLALTSWVVFANMPGGRAYLTIVPLIWIALRLGPRAVVSAVVLVASWAIWRTLHGSGPFATSSDFSALLQLLFFLCVVSLTSMALASAVTALQKLTAELEQRVRERTSELQSANAALRAKESQLSLVTDITPVALTHCSREGRYLFVNRAYAQILRHTPEELIGRPIREILGEEAYASILPYLQRVLSGQTVEYEEEIEIKAVGKRIYGVSYGPETNERGEIVGWVTSLRDITTERRAEQRLYDTNQRLNALLQAIPLGIAFSEEASCQSVTGNAVLRAQFEVPPGENISASAPDPNAAGRQICYRQAGRIVRPEELPLQRAAAENRIIAPQDFEIELPSGRRWVMECTSAPIRGATGEVIGAVGITKDITERRHAEEALEESRARFAGIVGAAMDAIITMDASQRVVLFNAAAERLFGCPADEALGSSIDRFIPARFREQHRKHVGEFGQTGTTSRALGTLGALHALRSDGSEFLMEASISQIEVRGGKLFTVILRDITRRIEDEQKLKAALKKEVILRREIHHRVKNNLQVIISLLYLQSARVSDAHTLEILRESQTRTRSIALTYELLSESEDLSKIEFAQYARRLTEHLLSAYKITSREVTLAIENGHIFLSLDTALPCGLILTELVSNALKHAFCDGRQGRIRIELLPAQNGFVKLVLSDDGMGLPEGFDLQNTPALGLKLVRDLTRQLEGTLEFESGHGTRVTVTFPNPAPHGIL